ncbi:hypothetical protein PENSUB_13411 [Penicillium subrubescens]|uniref:Uncharacterized protein n=1 Tax=Penicillium subrubescens TaxID=1316194 RepID=A0A1Q5SQJ8_9EURO|nr:hypothetical protein PENSUB_13411 [Penicillium subrubescens]
MALARSAQANSMWCLKAMRNLWESQDGALWERLGRVPEHRRQFYANCVKRLEIPSLAARSLAQMKLIVQGVTFNRLRHVSIHLRGYQRNIAFPKIDAPNVHVIHIHGVYVEILGQDRHRMMRNLACHVKQKLPHVRQIRFARRTRVYETLLRILKEKLPGVRISVSSE